MPSSSTTPKRISADRAHRPGRLSGDDAEQRSRQGLGSGQPHHLRSGRLTRPRQFRGAAQLDAPAKRARIDGVPPAARRPCTSEHRTRTQQHHGQHTVAHSTRAPRHGTPVRASSSDNAACTTSTPPITSPRPVAGSARRQRSEKITTRTPLADSDQDLSTLMITSGPCPRFVPGPRVSAAQRHLTAATRWR
jgi:hypothetical protein